MKLKSEIDLEIQKELKENNLNFLVDEFNNLKIYEYRMDKNAGIGMLYLVPYFDLPKGKQPYIVISVQWVYCVFYYENKASIIEIGTNAIDGEIIDYYSI
ncbi:MAG: hypothetical protein U0354_05505 [Candidatus Sericytochromatia bacterium]